MQRFQNKTRQSKSTSVSLIFFMYVIHFFDLFFRLALNG